MISLILVSCGLKLKDISGSANVPYMYVQSEKAPDHKNIFGGGFRPAGYASDPNYATLLLLIACIATLKVDMKKRYKIPLMLIFLTGIGLACSKTILAASALGIVILLIIRYIKIKPKFIKAFNMIFVLSVVLANIFIIKIPEIREYMPSTLTTRFTMWNSASELFCKSPIIGNGITSFRSYFKTNHWYVHCHSTYWQIISELGIIGILLYGCILYKLLNNCKKDGFRYFMIFVYIIYAITYETIAMQFIVYFLYLMNIENTKKEKEKKALFMVNTLSDGGAERVCINMANELLDEGYGVDFIILGENEKNKKTYDIDNRIKIYNLSINEKNKIKKILKILFSINTVDNIILENEKDGKYSLITSHLPMSNILTMLSVIRNRAIYVFHTKVSSYDKSEGSPIFKILIKYMYGNKKIVAVSEGVRQESIEIYKLKETDVKTIYNPIDKKNIEEKSEEKIENIGKYFLQVGRFNKAKRQDRMIEIFYKGNFYKSYKLVFCGTGELEQNIKDKVKELKIEDRVIFLGWQSNVYKWMKNSELLVCTSDNEAFPMTLVEAISCDTKVVSSDCKFGPSEILLGEYAKFLVKPDDIQEYIEKIKLALKHYPKGENPIIEQCKAKKIIKEYVKFME